MLGWPLVGYSASGLPTVRSTLLSNERDCRVYRISFEIMDGLTMSGLYFEMHGDEKRPLILVQHGGKGTPELISGLYGDTTNYNDMLARVTSCGVHAFAPQLLLWDQKYDVPFDRVNLDARLKRLGGSITALELYGLSRILDYFETKENVLNFGMVGLSYGGFYTLYLAAIDTRIASAVSCSYFNTRDRYPWSDWTWQGAAEKFDDAEIACLVYPRRLCIELGESDTTFEIEPARASYAKLERLCAKVGGDWLSLVTFDGTHEFCKDDAPIEALVRHLTNVN